MALISIPLLYVPPIMALSRAVAFKSYVHSSIVDVLAIVKLVVVLNVTVLVGTSTLAT